MVVMAWLMGAAWGQSQPLQAGERFVAPVPGWFVPEATADRCLRLAEENDSLERAVNACRTQCLPALEQSEKALREGQRSLAEKEEQVVACLTEQTSLMVRQAQLKRQRNTAYGMLGAAAVTAAAIFSLR